MAIQANELRIGNWVEHIFNGHKWEITISDFVEEYEMGQAFFHMKPIPLTEDILRTAGFTNQELDEWSVFAYKETPICAYWDGVEWVFKYGFDSDLCFASCQFLHQFQNLIFALTREELQISF